MQKELYKLYKKNGSDFFESNGDVWFRTEKDLFCLVKVDQIDSRTIDEIKYMSAYMQQHGLRTIATPVINTKKQLISTINNNQMILYRCNDMRQLQLYREGEELAEFHKRGLYFPMPIRERNRIGMWRELWIQRLNQLESWNISVMQKSNMTKIDVLFLETFPYYLGLTENAIQYLVDAISNDPRFEQTQGTICCYNEDSNHRFGYKFSVDWLLDHHSRDIAEWIRAQYFIKEEDVNHNYIVQFLNDYERVFPITKLSWKMIYARLLFPLHYFSSIEDYYSSTNSEEEKTRGDTFIKIVEDIDKHESSLKNFFSNIGLSQSSLKMKSVGWL